MSTTPVKVTILEKEYLVACPAEEREGLLRSADYLNAKMREIRGSGKLVGLDRVAVMAALNIAHELLQARGDLDRLEEVRGRLQAMDAKLAGALDR